MRLLCPFLSDNIKQEKFKYICAESIVGSANASSAGLAVEGQEARHWTELALATSEVSAVQSAQDWFERQWNRGEPVSTKDIEDARLKWQIARNNRALDGAAEGGLLQAASAHPESFKDLNIHIVVSTEDLSDEGRDQVKKRSQELGREVSAFEDWPSIPIGAILVCFSYDAVNGFCADEPMVYFTERVKLHSRMKWLEPCKPDRVVRGLKVERVGVWKGRLAKAKELHKSTWRKDGGMCQSLYDFVRSTN